MQVRKAYPKILSQSHGLRMFTRVTPILLSGQLQPSLPAALVEAKIELTNTFFLLSWKKMVLRLPKLKCGGAWQGDLLGRENLLL